MISLLILFIFVLEKYNNLNKKYKEAINYLIVGGLTTVVSITTYWIARLFIDSYKISNIISWIFAVLFAYITNRKYVFHSNNVNKVKEMFNFLLSRIATLVIEFIFLYIFVSIIHIDDRISKIIVQVIIIILNYIFSKLFVFKDKE